MISPAVKSKIFEAMDGNEAAARVAYALSDVIAIYPITPSSTMGEASDEWSAKGVRNLWGTVPSVVEMQSEGGAAGAIHGALQTGALATTFTSSQGLLLMLPNMFKIAGELTPAVFHIAARALATQALSIFGDHSDVMAARSTGWAMLSSANVQEAHDFALIAHAASLETRVPFIHFFDGFRTSHEVSQIEVLTAETMRAMIDEARVLEHRGRALSPDHPVLRGSAQNPDVYFQGRETVNAYYARVADRVQALMDKFAGLTGRSYKLFEYHGSPRADRVAVAMGSGGDTLAETARWLEGRGERVGVLQARLFLPFDGARFVAALPKTASAIAVLDRTKEPGSSGEPLYLNAVNAFVEAGRPAAVVGGRYGLGSKEFTPAMAAAVFENLRSKSPKNHFTVGIDEDVTHSSLEVDASLSIEHEETFRALFYGLGADGTVGANKETIKIIANRTGQHAQAYFVYDSRKSGSETVSHLRFGPRPIRSPYLIEQAHFIGVHQPVFLERTNVAALLRPGGVLLLNTPRKPAELWETLPPETQKSIREKNARVFVIDALAVARAAGMGGRINTVMQVCFFAVSGVLPKDEAIQAVKDSIKKAYGRKGDEVVQKNIKAVDEALSHLFELTLTEAIGGAARIRPPVPAEAPPFVRAVLGEIIAGRGDRVPVSAMPCDGTFPTATTRWEKRNIATDIPVWEASICIQCGKCVMVCPHAAIRSKAYDAAALAAAPKGFRATDARLPEWKGLKYTLQTAPEDCTGCGLCVDVCPARDKSEARLKAINMRPQAPLREAEAANWDFFLSLPDIDRRRVTGASVREMQTLVPLFEFSGACAGCGETPYLKLLTQLFGDRMVVGNATGCSSIFGGNLPTTPWSVNREGRGPAWSSSLFEDNAEFALGYRVSLDKQREFARELLAAPPPQVGEKLAQRILGNAQRDEADIHEARQDVAELKRYLAGSDTPEARRLLAVADNLVRRSVWAIGGDGWAYDIGFGGLDHVLASGRNVKVLVLDTEVYSNTGGQASKSTPRGAVAKFCAGGKPTRKKDLGLIAMSYGNVYVATVAMGSRDEQTLKAFLEAEAYDGPALIIAYAHCIAHGIDMVRGLQDQKAVVSSGQWLLYRFDPRRAGRGENPLQLDSPAPRQKVADFFAMENRFRILEKSHPDEAHAYVEKAQLDADERRSYFEFLASRPGRAGDAKPKPAGSDPAPKPV